MFSGISGSFWNRFDSDNQLF